MIGRLALAAGICLFIFANQARAELAPEDLYEKYKPAVVKIDTFQRGIRIGQGSGFFVSSDGVIVTNAHVLSPGLTSQFSAEITTADGKVFKTFTIAGCRDQRGMDICVIKVPFKPKSWITSQPTKLKPGQQVYVIGHPKGYEFTISSGMLSGVRNLQGGIEQVQMTASTSPGNSGGPILNSSGELLGMTTWMRGEADSNDLNFGISNKEIVNYVSKTNVFRDIAVYRANETSLETKKIELDYKTQVKPAFAALSAAEKDNRFSRALDKNYFVEVKSTLR